MEFSKQQIIGLGGGITLLLGIFLPVVSMPIMGSMSIFSSGRVDGYVLLGLAIISLLLVYSNKTKQLRIAGGISLLIVLSNFIYLIYKLKKMKGEIAEKLQGNPFGGFGEAMLNTIQIQYGWVFLFLGCVILLYVAFAKNVVESAPIERKPPKLPNITPRSSSTKLVATDMFAHNAGNKAQLNADGVEQKNCPDCRELIRFDARKCKHCGSMIEDAT